MKLRNKMLDRYGAVVTIFVFEMETFERETHEPLFCNIRREGVLLRDFGK